MLAQTSLRASFGTFEAVVWCCEVGFSVSATKKNNRWSRSVWQALLMPLSSLCTGSAKRSKVLFNREHFEPIFELHESFNALRRQATWSRSARIVIKLTVSCRFRTVGDVRPTECRGFPLLRRPVTNHDVVSLSPGESAVWVSMVGGVRKPSGWRQPSASAFRVVATQRLRSRHTHPLE